MAARASLRKLWGGLRQRREAARIRKQLLIFGRFINAYGAVMQRHPIGFVDASLLPTNKEALKLAIKVTWRLTADESIRRMLGAGFVNLYRFQRGVGPRPITSLPDVNLRNFDLGSAEGRKAMQEVMEATDAFLGWAKRTEAEMLALAGDFESFERAERSRARR